MPRPHIPKTLQREIINCTRELFEYCPVHQNDRPERHQLDHITALKHGGETDSENLALACVVCNKYKRSEPNSIDPLEQILVPLFNPRTQIWTEHFELANAQINGLTAVGRVTVELLRLIGEGPIIERQKLIRTNRYPYD